MTKEFHKIQGQLGLESARLVWATSKVISQTNKQKKSNKYISNMNRKMKTTQYHWIFLL